MLSEGAIRADRICKAIAGISKETGATELDLYKMAYVLQVAAIFREGDQWDSVPFGENSLPDAHALASTSDAQTASEEFERLLGSIAQLLGVEPDLQMSIDGSWSRAVNPIAQMVDYEISNLDQNGVRHVLDVLFYKLYSSITPTTQRHNTIVARLASAFFRHRGGVEEVFPGPGEVLIQSHTPIEDVFDGQQWRLNQPRLRQLHFLRLLRLSAHGLAGVGGRRNSTGFTSLRLLDRSLELKRGSSVDHTSKPLVEELRSLVGGHDGRSTLVVIPSKARRPLKRDWLHRENLVENTNLRAVVDFPFLGGKSSGACTALFFGPRTSQSNSFVTHIDARQLRPNLHSDEVLTCMSLVSVMVHSWIEGIAPSKADLEETNAPRRVLAFVEEGLSTNEEHIPGFLRRVHRDEMREHDYSLRAEDYVGVRQDNTWRPQTEIDPILELLDDARQRVAVYLIGNNGAGKSLALHDVAMALAYKGKKTFGVAFGTTDRFERVPKSDPLKQHFTYAGARTTQSGSDGRRTLGQLGDMVKAIYQSDRLLSCFQSALDALGFERQQYLVPVAMRSTSDHWERLLAEVHPLSAESMHSPAREEFKLWRSLPSGQYKIAVVRSESKEVVVFDSLSSGEQQLLTMVIKIVANVGADTTVLLDEPEISLHVAWQRQLPDVLRAFARELGCSFVVATHSPVVVASTSDPRDHCFEMKNRRLSSIPPERRRSVEASLFEGFRTYTPNTHHIQERCAEIVSRFVGESETHDDEIRAIDSNNNLPLKELEELRKSLDRVRDQSATDDIRLINSAIAALQEVLSQ